MKKILLCIHCVMAFTLLLFTGYQEVNLFAGVSGKIEYQIQCTPIPSLYENWRRTVIEEDMHKRVEDVSEREFMEYVQKLRETRVANLNPRFLEIARMTPTQREDEGERVLWENAKIMVLVDTKNQAPKLLIVAKIEGVWLIKDADEQLRKDIANIAAATSDALREVGKRSCKPDAISEIEIHSIHGLGMQQLHIHVQPKWKLNSGESDIPFYEGVKKRLVQKLKVGSTN